jgi:hypothetical protein
VGHHQIENKKNNSNSVYQYSKTNVMHFLLNLLRTGPLHVPSINSLSSGGHAQTAVGILRACYVSWLHHSNPGAAN